MSKKEKDAEYGPRIRLKGQTLMPGKWTKAENRKYMTFLLDHKQKFQNYGLRQSYGIYKQMSNKIPGRTSDQCRGHHRRMLQAYKTIDRILQRLRKSQLEQTQQQIVVGSQWRLNIRKLKIAQTNKQIGIIDIMVSLNMDSLYEW